jgi:hypothetical protein
MIEIKCTEYHDETVARVSPYRGRSFTSSRVIYNNEEFFFWTSHTNSGKLRLCACRIYSPTGKHNMPITKYVKDRGELIFATVDRFFNMNSVKKALA